MKKVLVTDPLSQPALDLLEARGLQVINLAGAPIIDVVDILGTVHGWIISSGTEVDAELLNRADMLQLVACTDVSVQNIDVDVATLRGVVVISHGSDDEQLCRLAADYLIDNRLETQVNRPIAGSAILEKNYYGEKGPR